MTVSSVPSRPPAAPSVEGNESGVAPADPVQRPPRPRSGAKAVRPSLRARPPERCRVSTSLPRDLRDRLAKYCAAEGTTESAIVSAALDQYLESSSDKELLMRRLDRLDHAVGQVRRSLDLQSEAFVAFLKIWFAHTPSVKPDGRRAALTISEARYLQFIEYVAARLARGERFTQDLARQYRADGDEPVSAATNKPPPLGAKEPGADAHGAG